MEYKIKTKFHTYVSFSSQYFDTTPDADNDSGMIEIPTVCLDGDFMLEDLKNILIKMEKHVEENQNEA